jgi:hypothetical protein
MLDWRAWIASRGEFEIKDQKRVQIYVLKVYAALEFYAPIAIVFVTVYL